MKKILEHDIVGAGDTTLFFIHGWPDGPELWHDYVQYFSHKFRCVTVRLPNFGEKIDSKKGHSFPELVELLANTIKIAQKDQVKDKVVVIGHDWGAYLAYMLESAHPELVEKMVTLDVGAKNSFSSKKEAAFMVGYQWWLTLAWFMGKKFPKPADYMSYAFAKSIKSPAPENARSQMNYMYYYLWRGMLFKKHRKSILYKYKPKHPILYIYGEDKPCMFHNKDWEKTVEKHPNSKVVALPASGHWVTRDGGFDTLVEIESWLGA